jgi:HD-GYP domain-containing protein (c-di-GMP phosphodiesterase class II)
VETTLVALLAEADPVTYAHSRRVAARALELATEASLPLELTLRAYRVALTHDLGKLLLRPELVHGDRFRSPWLYAYLTTHAERGARWLEALGLESHAAVARYHHSRFDGRPVVARGGQARSLYPCDRAGSELPLLARLVAVCDCWDAIVVARSYARAATTLERAQERLLDDPGQLDPELAELFVAALSEKAWAKDRLAFPAPDTRMERRARRGRPRVAPRRRRRRHSA